LFDLLFVWVLLRVYLFIVSCTTYCVCHLHVFTLSIVANSQILQHVCRVNIIYDACLCV